MPKGIRHRILYLGPRINSPRIVTEPVFGGELTVFEMFAEIALTKYTKAAGDASAAFHLGAIHPPAGCFFENVCFKIL